MHAQVVEITPELAREWLEMNGKNRPINQAHVERLAEEMKGGRWKLNGDTICLNGSSLIDGQHRLSAIVKAGVSVKTLVVTGIDSDTFATKDIGRRRGAADVLSILGEVNTNVLAGALLLVHRYDNGSLLNTKLFRGGSSPTKIAELLEAYPDIRESVRVTYAVRNMVASSVIAAAHFITARIDRESADLMLRDLRDGAGLNYGDPVLLLRNRYLSNENSKGKLGRVYILALYIKAWNGRRRGLPVKNLRWREDGRNGIETFPVAI